ncbi:16983_t:CDS:2, partial [Cetraspora pellucida]
FSGYDFIDVTTINHCIGFIKVDNLYYIIDKEVNDIAFKELNDSQTNTKLPSHRSLAKKYGISETTFRHVIKNGGPLDHPGPAKVLTDHKEQQLVSYCLNMQKLGFRLAKSGVNQYIMDIVHQSNKFHPFKESGPAIIENHLLTSDQIWNMDEMGFIINPTFQKVIAKKAARMYISPLIIYKGNHIIPGLLNGIPAGSVMGFTDTGYMKECLFQKYIKYFIRSIPPTHSVLLILDSHKSHVSYACISLCYNNNILLYALSPYTTHILQPAELSFTHLKQAYDKEQFDTSPMQPSLQPSIPTSSLQPSTSPLQASSNLDPNSTLNSNKKRSLKTEIETLNIRVEQLEAELKATKDELETFKNSSTSRSKFTKKKKKETILFSQLFTNETSLRLLKDVKKEAKRKANEIKQKKEAAMQKRIARAQKKKELECTKAKDNILERGKKKLDDHYT